MTDNTLTIRDLEPVLLKPELDPADAIKLFRVDDSGLFDLLKIANDACYRTHGNRVSFVINRNINFTNVCKYKCRFCAFSVDVNDPGGFLLSADDVRKKTLEAKSIEPGCTEICIQGGLHPGLTIELIEDYIKAVKNVDGKIHVHGFSPQEIWNLAREEGSSITEIIDRLYVAGLDSVPGTAAEILVDRVRKIICPSKLKTAQWVDTITKIHEAGIPSTATIMYGHVETIEDIVEHMKIIRDIQKRTGKFTEFVPLPFLCNERVSSFIQERAKPKNGLLDLKLHAIARLFFKNSIDNIQCSWVKLGVKFCQLLLHAGVNDFSGTLMEENISRMAGATTGQYISSERM
ncbi:MAG: 5-amino-6-(D-ribitylamino)uracil--L-tyrosine 4-hydroxyphenyl transferase CofH, partial [Promethearchaeota archaeon]